MAPRALGGICWVVRSATGARLSKHDLPEAFCSALRRALEHAPTAEKLEGLWQRNHPTLLHLRSAWPDLKTVNGTHYADVLEGIYEQQTARLKEASTQAQNQDEIQGTRPPSTNPSLPWPCRSGCATESTCSSWRRCLASCAGAHPVMHIIFVSPSHAPWEARSATSGLCHFAPFIIEHCTMMARKSNGG